jgi:hypothetical protein
LNLQNRIRIQNEENEKLRDILKQKIMSRENLLKLFGDTNYEDQFNFISEAFKRGIEERISKLESKLSTEIKHASKLVSITKSLKESLSKKDLEIKQIGTMKKIEEDSQLNQLKSQVEQFKSEKIELDQKIKELSEKNSNLNTEILAKNH